MTGVDPIEPRKHLLPDLIDWAKTPAMQNVYNLANQPLAALSRLENAAAFRQLDQLTDRPLAGAGITQFLEHRAVNAASTFSQITGMRGIDEMYRFIAPSAFHFDPARYGIAAPTAMELVDPLSTSWYVNRDAFSDWITEYVAGLRRIGRRDLPSNLAEIPDIGFYEVADFSARTGIPLYRVPRRKIAERLLRARKLSRARTVLVDHWKKIVDDCRQALGSCDRASALCQMEYAFAALDTADAGHLHAAQTLATAALDSELTYQFNRDKHAITNHDRNPDGDFADLGPAAALAFGPIWRAHSTYRPINGDPIPRRYNRHATIHSVCPRQFRKSNAITALMVLTSFICWINDNADTEKTVQPGGQINGT